ncbi:MAG TPA: lamin tail domain-containing protein, partial [Flavobacteriales bacterium]|nr:lamin tail domain-containing protein [Flavobacteriales bacterium]
MNICKCILIHFLLFGLIQPLLAGTGLDNESSQPAIQQISGCLVINEVHIRPTGFYGQKTREFIELYNTSGTDTIDLTGWYLRTDLNNDVSNPDFGDVRIVTWADRFPGTSPFDSVAGWLDT